MQKDRKSRRLIGKIKVETSDIKLSIVAKKKWTTLFAEVRINQRASKWRRWLHQLACDSSAMSKTPNPVCILHIYYNGYIVIILENHSDQYFSWLNPLKSSKITDFRKMIRHKNSKNRLEILKNVCFRPKIISKWPILQWPQLTSIHKNVITYLKCLHI